jgi:hypothetical protein
MNAGARWKSRATFAFVWLALFSAVYTAGDAFGIWPQLPPGAFRDLDLAVGAIAVAALALWLATRRSSA